MLSSQSLLPVLLLLDPEESLWNEIVVFRCCPTGCACDICCDDSVENRNRHGREWDRKAHPWGLGCAIPCCPLCCIHCLCEDELDIERQNQVPTESVTVSAASLDPRVSEAIESLGFERRERVYVAFGIPVPAELGESDTQRKAFRQKLDAWERSLTGSEQAMLRELISERT